MARWKLTTAHYLKVPGVEWEQQQTSQLTGKTIRHRYEVPLLLDPKDPADWNYRDDQMIVVCWEGQGDPRDIVFLGNPTADMEPMDREAQEISKKLEPTWKHPIESLQAQGGFGPTLLADLQKQLEAAIREAAAAVVAPAQTQSLGGVSPEAFAALQAQVQQLMEANVALQQQLMGDGRPLTEEEEPLPPEAPIAPAAPAQVERRA